jgi:hypothetical protein
MSLHAVHAAKFSADRGRADLAAQARRHSPNSLASKLALGDGRGKFEVVTTSGPGPGQGSLYMLAYVELFGPKCAM